MAGPWDDFQTADGPWSDFSKPARPRGRQMAADAKAAMAKPVKGPGSAPRNPVRLEKALKPGSPEYRQAVAALPQGAYYMSGDGKIRRNDNGAKGNPVVGTKQEFRRTAAQNPDQPRWMKAATGAAANLNRGLVVGDEASAALGVVGDVVTGNLPSGNVLNALGQSYSSNLAQQRGYEDQFTKERPWTAAGLRTAGTIPTLFVPGGAVAQGTSRGATIASTAGNAALQGATAGYLDRGSVEERNRSGLIGGTVGGVLGGLAGLVTTRGAPKPVAAPKPATPQKVLQDNGVFLTPGQRVGGLAKTTEDLAMRAPIVGPAIASARSRGVESLNRSVALQALRPVGVKLPKDVKPGYDTVKYVDDALGKVYDNAFDMVPSVRLDQGLADDFARIGQRRVDLPDSEAATFERIIRDRVARLGKGDLSGRDVKQISQEIGSLSAEYRARGNNTMADMLGDTRRALGGLVSRQNPEAGALIAKADEGWGIYKILNSAAGKADARGGVATAGQLTTAGRTAARRQGVNVAGKGEGRLQDLTSAAQQVMPDGFGNPGTANALGLGGLGVGAVTDPVTTVGVAGGLTAAATPYFLMGRKIIEELPATASAAQIGEAQQSLARLAQSDPAVKQLQRDLAVRLSRLSGGQNTPPQAPRNALATASQ